jgi:hypothetical protein
MVVPKGFSKKIMRIFIYAYHCLLKKLLSILILGVYLFNLAGYSLFTNYFIQQSDEKMVQQIDNNNIDEQQLVEIKTPVNIPYYNDSRDYERMDGQIVLNGVHYNYVKRKIQNDTLYLLCLPNIEKTALYKEKNNFTSQVNDLPSNNKENNSAKKNSLSNEYVYQFIQHDISAPVKKIQQHFNTIPYPVLNGYILVKGQPPQHSC